MGIYAKKKFQTAPVQAVTEPSLASNSSTNVPTIEAVNKGFAKKQLLINNDFQINQRGQSSYANNGYTLDMWKLKKTNVNATVESLSKGIKLTSIGTGYVNYEQEFKNRESGKEYTLVMRAENVSKTAKMELVAQAKEISNYKTVSIENGINVLHIPSDFDFNIVYVQIQNSGNLDIEYIDLFEGDIAYPHVKKKYSEDLIECMYYVQKGRLMSIPYGYKGNNVFYFRAVFNLPIKMKSTPIIDYDHIDCTNIGELDKSKIKAIAVDRAYIGGTMHIDLGTSSIDTTAYIKYPMYLYFTLSCEPL